MPTAISSGRHGEDSIPLQPVNAYGYGSHDVVENAYVSSGSDEEGKLSRGPPDIADVLPSARITALNYRQAPNNVRRRKSSAATLHRPKQPVHIKTTWLNDPKLDHQVEMDIIANMVGEVNEGADSEVVQAKHIDELRGLTIGLSRKKVMKDKLRNASVKKDEGVSRSISCWRSTKYTVSMWKLHAQSAILAFLRELGLWDGHLKTIASNFGSDVLAYFLFLRWLFVANALIGSVILIFLLVPHYLERFGAMVSTSQNTSTNEPAYHSRDGSEFIVGKDNDSSGFFDNTGMYYGHYYNDTASGLAGANVVYNMPLAYLLTYGVYFLLFFLVIAISAAKSYRVNFVESSDKFTFQYVLKVLDGWDYSIDNEEVSVSKKKNICRDLKEFCATRNVQKESDGFYSKVTLLVTRIGAYITQFIIIGGCGVAVYYTVDMFGPEKGSKTLQGPPILRDIIQPLILTAINAFVPFIFSLIPKYLKFTNPKSAVYSSLAMTLLLYGVTLLVFFGLPVLRCGSDAVKEAVNVDSKTSSCDQCWESRLGEKAYSLVFIDFLFLCLTTILAEVFYKLVSLGCRKKIRGPQFDIARNTMSLIYSQFLLWLGIFYSPLLTVVVCVKIIIIFYIKRVTAMTCCIPTTKPWRAARMHTIFLCLLFLGFVVCVIMFGVVITVTKPSRTCGPFTNVSAVIDVITSMADDDNKNNVMDILLSPGFVVGIIVILSVIVHYVRVVSTGKRKLISLLKIQIMLESKDKVYLRHMLDRVQRHKESVHRTKSRGEITNTIISSRSSQAISKEGHRHVFAKQRSTANLTDDQRVDSRANLLANTPSSKSNQQTWASSVLDQTASKNSDFEKGKGKQQPTRNTERESSKLTANDPLGKSKDILRDDTPSGRAVRSTQSVADIADRPHGATPSKRQQGVVSAPNNRL